MIAPYNVIFLLDVDNTLLDNDCLRDDLMRRLAQEFGAESRDRYSAILEELRGTGLYRLSGGDATLSACRHERS